MIDVMVDLETVGNKPGCGILSIGAVFFDAKAGELGAEHYEVVRLSTCEAVGLVSDQSTLDWWAGQSPEARQVLTQAGKKSGNVEFTKALENFDKFLAPAGRRSVRVWGNGSDFDNAILAVAYGKAGVQQGWEFWNNRCYRTLKGFVPQLKAVRTGTYHNALDDAKTQAVHACQLLKHLKLV